MADEDIVVLLDEVDFLDTESDVVGNVSEVPVDILNEVTTEEEKGNPEDMLDAWPTVDVTADDDTGNNEE